MSTCDEFLSLSQASGKLIVTAGGSWTVQSSEAILRCAERVEFGAPATVEFDFRRVEQMDTTGALLVRKLAQRMKPGVTWHIRTNERNGAILETLERYQKCEIANPPVQPFLIRKLEHIGKATIQAIELVACFVVFIGAITSLIVLALAKPSRFRFGQMLNQVELSGFNAIPIVSLISFLIGIVVAYQGALQLGKLGADIYTVDLLAVTILREMGILLTAVVVAGRSGSTYAAEIGSMRLSQELDAMRTIGMEPIEVLVIPRLLGLIISLPILTLIANFFGVLGGAIMIWLTMDMSPELFMNQFLTGLPPWTFWVGIIKAPVFAYIIAIIGCYEGMQVVGTSESLGKHTTRAVVESIFLIIVFDALFSIFFGIIGI